MINDRMSSKEAFLCCTCITYNNGDFYFGRNLDLDCSFGETVVITPRNFPLPFRHAEALERHYAMIGMASASPVFRSMRSG